MDQQRSHDDRISHFGLFAHALPCVGVLPDSPHHSSSLCRVCMFGFISDATEDLMNEKKKSDGENKAGSRWLIHPAGL